jgi:hypothetical protein
MIKNFKYLIYESNENYFDWIDEYEKKQIKTEISEDLKTNKKLFLNELPNIFYLLHLLYENNKIISNQSNFENEFQSFLLKLLLEIIYNTKDELDHFLDYYERENTHFFKKHDFKKKNFNFNLLNFEFLNISNLQFYHKNKIIPNLYEFIHFSLKKNQKFNFPVLNNNTIALENLRKISKLFYLLSNTDLKNLNFYQKHNQKFSDFYSKSNNSYENVVIALFEENILINNLKDFNFGISFPIFESINKVKLNPPDYFPKEIYKIIERDDLSYLLDFKKSFKFKSTYYYFDGNDDENDDEKLNEKIDYNEENNINSNINNFENDIFNQKNSEKINEIVFSYDKRFFFKNFI